MCWIFIKKHFPNGYDNDLSKALIFIFLVMRLPVPTFAQMNMKGLVAILWILLLTMIVSKQIRSAWTKTCTSRRKPYPILIMIGSIAGCMQSAIMARTLPLRNQLTNKTLICIILCNCCNITKSQVLNKICNISQRFVLFCAFPSIKGCQSF